MKRNLLASLLIGFALAGHAETENLRTITYDEAIRIALGESYTVKYYKEDMDATATLTSTRKHSSSRCSTSASSPLRGRKN